MTAARTSPRIDTDTNTDKTAIRPFTVKLADSDIAELRRRVQATRWPDKETVSDQSQGVQLATLKPLVEY